MKTRLARLAILILSLSGSALSIVSLRSHYAASETEYCDLNAMFNCDVVNRSKFSELFGVPVALIGLIGYLVLLGFTVRESRSLKFLRFLMSLAGLAFALYLAYIEAFVLRTWCLLCIGSLISIIGIVVASAAALLQRSSKNQLNSSAR